MNAMTVVVATDGSLCAQVALDLAGAIPWPEGSVVHLVTVVERGSAIYAPSVIGAVGDPVEREIPMIGDMANELARAALPLDAKGREVETHVLVGRPATAIVELAELVRADILVVGSRGHGTIGSMVLGSVSAEVADHAHCPVLVARRSTWQRAMLGVDGSDFSRRAEDMIETWPIFAGLSVDAVSIAETDLTITSTLALAGRADSLDLPATRRAIIDEHEHWADEARGRLVKAGRNAVAISRTGDPAAQILRAAREQDTDVVVVGTHGRTGMLRALAGSVARNVMLHAPCSVVVVRETRPLA